MTAAGGATPMRRRGGSSTGDRQEVTAYCARPSCGREFRRVVQPGHPQRYHDESCRRAAEQEMRRIRARLRDLKSTVRQQQRLLAAYGGTDTEEDADVAHAAAVSALDRAEGALRFLPDVGGDYEAVAAEFRSLVEVVAPALRSM